jgi:hypothetical protein
MLNVNAEEPHRRNVAAGDQVWDESVRFLTQMDPWSASTRYRALQYVPHVQRWFTDVRVSLAGDTIRRLPGRLGQARYFGSHAMAYAKRGVEVSREIREDDSLFIQRGLYPIGPGLIVRSLGGFSGRVVFDLDDAVFRTSPNLAEKSSAARWLYGPQQALALLRRADAIVVSTSMLADLLPTGTVEPVVIPTVPDPSVYPTRTHADTGIATIGWAGTVGGLSYLDPLTDVFGRLRSADLAELEVVCSAPWPGPARFHRWDMAEETSLFQRFDIGIMPLPDTDYTRAKAGFKLLQYMAAGLPVVASPIGINRELVERSGGGLLADSPKAWEASLAALARDPELRSALGQRGRSFVEGYADIPAKAGVLANLLHGSIPE